MTDLNRNTRTLIVSFVIAIFALVPLRFVEVGQELAGYSTATVLGDRQEAAVWETSSNEGKTTEYEPVIKLEAPYDRIDSLVLGAVSQAGEETEMGYSQSGCVSQGQARVMIEEMYEAGASSTDMQLVANSVCR